MKNLAKIMSRFAMRGGKIEADKKTEVGELKGHYQKEIKIWQAEKDALMQDIIKNHDWNRLYTLEDNRKFSWTLEQMLWYFVTWKEDGNCDLSRLSGARPTLFFVLQLENATQADALFNFFEEGFAVYGSEAVQALEDVGVPQCAAALKAVVNILPSGVYPKGDKAFWDSIMSGEYSDIWNEADDTLVDYADVFFSDLCRIYAEAYRIVILAE